MTTDQIWHPHILTEERVREIVREELKELRFKKPKLIDLEKILGSESQKFYDFYESKGWKVGKSPMKSWEAAARNWMRNKKVSRHDEAERMKNEILDKL